MTRWTQAEVDRVKNSISTVAAEIKKFRNVPTNGYHSKKESKRAADLALLLQAGRIRELREQVRFELIPVQRSPAGVLLERSVHYVADFTYVNEDGRLIVEDVKGFRDSGYILKRKLMLSVHKIRIRET